MRHCTGRTYWEIALKLCISATETIPPNAQLPTVYSWIGQIRSISDITICYRSSLHAGLKIHEMILKTSVFINYCSSTPGPAFSTSPPPFSWHFFRHYILIFLSDFLMTFYNFSDIFWLYIFLKIFIDSVRYNAHHVTGTSQVSDQCGHRSDPRLYIRAKRPTLLTNML